MKTKHYFLITALLFVSTALWATDPFVGQWTLNIQKSKYPPGTCPKRMVIEMEPTAYGIRYRSDTTLANGSSTYSEYIADYNGKQAIVMGAHGMLLPVSLKRTNANTVVASYTKSLQVVATSRRIVSQDGKLMTITTTSRDQSGKTVTNVGIYERTGHASPQGARGSDQVRRPRVAGKL
jgi:hypothetical protein